MVLEEAIAEMDEVVITGYFQRKKDSYTGAATTFRREVAGDFYRKYFVGLIDDRPLFKLMEDITAGSDRTIYLNFKSMAVAI